MSCSDLFAASSENTKDQPSLDAARRPDSVYHDVNVSEILHRLVLASGCIVPRALPIFPTAQQSSSDLNFTERETCPDRKLQQDAQPRRVDAWEVTVLPPCVSPTWRIKLSSAIRRVGMREPAVPHTVFTFWVVWAPQNEGCGVRARRAREPRIPLGLEQR